MVSCPRRKEVKTEKSQTKVFFPKAVFKDNVGVVRVVTNRANGSMVSLGDHDITYTAFDKAENNITCVLKLYVNGKEILS